MGADCRGHPAPPNETRAASRPGGARELRKLAAGSVITTADYPTTADEPGWALSGVLIHINAALPLPCDSASDAHSSNFDFQRSTSQFPSQSGGALCASG